jgi:group I intron endonuclease
MEIHMAQAEKKIAVYRILNTESGTYYLGSSTNLYERWRTHRKKLRAGTHPNPKLQASWRKHGETKFAFIILAEFETVGDMETCEEALLVDFVADPLCCNLSTSATTPWRNKGALHPQYGTVRTEDTKKNLRSAAIKQWATSDPRTGKVHSEKTKALISEKVQACIAEGRGGKFIPSEDTRAKMSASLLGNQNAKGHVRTEEHRRKLSEATKGNTNFLGKTHSDATRDKMGRAVVAVSPDGVEHHYSTITKLRAALELTPPTVHRAMESGVALAKGKCKGWLFRYA